MEIAIYLFIGLIVQVVYRIKIDKIGYETKWTFFALPELWFVRLALWPLYLVNLCVTTLGKKKNATALGKE